MTIGCFFGTSNGTWEHPPNPEPRTFSHNTKHFFTVCKRSYRKVIFSQVCVKNSVHGGRCTPPRQKTPRADTPPLLLMLWGIEAFSLCMFLVFAPSIKLSPSGSPCAKYKRGTGSKLVTRSSVFEIPVAE